MSEYTKLLLQRDGQCIDGTVIAEADGLGMRFAGDDWELTVSFPANLNKTVMNRIRRHIGDLVRVCVYLKDK